MRPSARPRPRGQARGQEPAREDAGAPLKRHWVVLILKDHQRLARLSPGSAAERLSFQKLVKSDQVTGIVSSSQPAWTIPGYLEIHNNRLHINGVDTIELAKEFDTPLFVVSAPRIRHNIARLLEATSHHKKIKLCYASKANNILGVLRVAHEA